MCRHVQKDRKCKYLVKRDGLKIVRLNYYFVHISFLSNGGTKQNNKQMRNNALLFKIFEGKISCQIPFYRKERFILL